MSKQASSHGSHGQGDHIWLAVSAIILAVFSLSLGDALIKYSSAEFALWQIFVLRSAIVLPILLGYLGIKSPNALFIQSGIGWMILRSALMVAMWIAYYLALPNLDLSIAAAAYYTAPIFISLFSAALLREQISALGWGAVVLGFIGVLLILRPRADDFNFYALLPLLSAILYALAMILTRAKCREMHPVVLAAGLNAGLVITGLVATGIILMAEPRPNASFLVAPWTQMTSKLWSAIGFLALVKLVASVGAAIAYQKGSPSVVGIFDFSYVGFATLWGIVFFVETPNPSSLVGIALIVIAGIISVKR